MLLNGLATSTEFRVSSRGVPKDDQKRLEDAVERHRTHTTPIHETYRIRRKDGTWLHRMDRGVPVLNDRAHPSEWIGVCTDITDIFMPERDGLQVIRDIHREFPDVKIIAVSGGGETVAGDFLGHAKLFGAHRASSKPLSLSGLAAAVRGLLHEAEQESCPAA